MPESLSTVQPQTLELDVVINGKARILVHWDIQTILIDEKTYYKSKEWVIIWQLPLTFMVGDTTIIISTRADVEKYIAEHADEIMGYAQAAYKLEKL